MVKQTPALMTTDHPQAVTKEKVQKAPNRHHIAQCVLNHTTMPANVKLSINFSATFAIRKNMQQKSCKQNEWTQCMCPLWN